MAVLTKQATLTQDEFTLLHRARGHRTRLTVTGIAGEFATIPMQTKIRGLLTRRPFEATEVSLSLIQTIPFAEILAKAPAGVGSLEINYEVRTREDA